MDTILYKRKQTIINQGNGGSLSALGFTWETKTSDFTAQVGKGYFCEPVDKLLFTLPSNPSVNDKVAIVLITGNKINITSLDKFNGSVAQTNYGKRVTTKNIIIVFTYSGNTNGWTWEPDYNSYISDGYLGDVITIPFTSVNNLNGLFDFIGRNSGLTTWSNPYPSKISISVEAPLQNAFISNPSNLFDKDTESFARIGGDNNKISYTTINLPANTKIQPTHIYIRYQNIVGGGQSLIVNGVKEDGTKVTLLTETVNYNSWSNYIQSINTIDFYKAFEIIRAEYHFNYGVFEVWGLYAL